MAESVQKLSELLGDVSFQDSLLDQPPDQPHSETGRFDTSYMNFDPNSELDLEEIDGDLEKFQEDEIVKGALEKGVDLRFYSRQIDQELRNAETSSIQDFMKEADDVAALHGQIKSCDGVLERMQQMLSSFQGDLSSISSEIQHLQKESSSMTLRLNNRKAAEARLGDFIGKVYVPESVVQTIAEGNVDEKYRAALQIVNEKHANLQSPAVTAEAAAAANEAAPIVAKLRTKALARLRHHLLHRVHALKKPQTNIQIKQNILLRNAPLYGFLQSLDQASVGSGTSGADVAAEVRTSYVNTMSQIYVQKFKGYMANMKKLQTENAVKRKDLLGNVEGGPAMASASSSSLMGSIGMGMFGTKRSTAQIDKCFQLRNRNTVLQDSGQDYIVYHAAAAAGLRYPFEVIFRSTQRLLMDSAASEFEFLTNFFSPPPPTDAAHAADTPPADARPPSPRRLDPYFNPTKTQADLLFKQVFSKTLNALADNFSSFLSDCSDSLAILIIIRLVCQHNQLMQARKVHCLQGYFDRCNMQAWPRFKQIFDLNLASLQALKGGALLATSLNPNSKGGAGTGPTALTRRFACYATALNLLNQGHNDEILCASLRRLRAELDRILKELADNALGKGGSSTSKAIFFISNYKLILSELEQARLDECAETLHYRSLLDSSVKDYVEGEMLDKFSSLVRAVQASDKAAATDAAGPSLDTLEAAGREFANSWKDGIERLSNSASKAFARPAKGEQRASKEQQEQTNEYLKQALVQLVLYYQRFQEIVKRRTDGKASFFKSLIPTQTILYEIKKYGKKE